MIYCSVHGYAGGRPTDADLYNQAVEPVLFLDREWYQNRNINTGVYDESAWAAYCRSIPPNSKVCLDVEIINRSGVWRITQQSSMPASPNGYGQNASLANIDEDCAYIKTLIDVFRANAPSSCELGMYNPFYDPYWLAIQGTQQELTQWRAANDYVVPRLIQYLDSHWLQCYTYYNVEAEAHSNENWKSHLDLALAESRRLSPNAKRMILICPQYHPSNETWKYRLLTDRQWKYTVDTATATGERVCLWDFAYLSERIAAGVPGFSMNTPFDFTWYWWRTFRDTRGKRDGSYNVTRVGEVNGDVDALFVKK